MTKCPQMQAAMAKNGLSGWTLCILIRISFSFLFFSAVGAGVHRRGVGERVERTAKVGLQRASKSPQQKREHQWRVRAYSRAHKHIQFPRHITTDQNSAKVAPESLHKMNGTKRKCSSEQCRFNPTLQPSCVVKRCTKPTAKTKVTFSVKSICQGNSLFPLGQFLFRTAASL